MYKSSLRHIHDPVPSSLKMKGIRLLFFIIIIIIIQSIESAFKLLTTLEHKLQNIRTKYCKLTYNKIKRVIIYVILQGKKTKTVENVCPFDIRMIDYRATV
jgi:hypothetical protein